MTFTVDAHLNSLFCNDGEGAAVGWIGAKVCPKAFGEGLSWGSNTSGSAQASMHVTKTLNVTKRGRSIWHCMM